MTKNPGDKVLTLEEIQEMVKNGKVKDLMARLRRYQAQISGSPAKWHRKGQQLRALFEEKGPGTIFFTLSCADYWWPELDQILGFKPTEKITHQMRVKAVIEKPHLIT